MPTDDDIRATDEPADEWQFGDWSPDDSALAGGGLLRTILDELIALRESVAADRAALTEAMASGFQRVDVQLTALHEELAGLRAAAETQAAVDVAALVQQAVAVEEGRLVEAIAAALSPPLAALRREIPTEHMARISTDIHHLRKLLIGPN